jgi:hypothetical protein
MRVFKGRFEWDFRVENLFADQQQLKYRKGTYRLSVISQDNAEPARCEVNVEYDGDWQGVRAYQV